MTKTLSQKLRSKGMKANKNNNKKKTVVVVRNRPLNQPFRKPRKNKSRKSGWLAETGGAVGSFFGMPKLGRAVGSGIGRIFGSGDYVVTPPSAIRSNTLAGSSPPEFGNATGSTRIRHREFVSDYSSSVLFNLTSYPLNPGMSNLFPWLSNIARNYEQYKIHGLCVEFKSTSAWAVSSTNTALGVVGCVTQYDASDADFTTKQQAENYQGCQNTSPAHSILHFIECAPGSNPLDKLYVRVTSLDSNQDIKMYDLGKLSLFSVGAQVASNIGEIWVSYDIELIRPKLPDSTSFAETVMDFYSATGVTGTVGPLGAGTGILAPVRSRLGSQYNFTSTRLEFPVNRFPKGTYLITILCGRTSGTLGTSLIGTFSNVNCDVLPVVCGTNLSNKTQPSTSTGSMSYSFVVRFYDAYATSGFSAMPYLSFSGWSFTDTYNTDIYIMPLNANWNVAPPTEISSVLEVMQRKIERLMRHLPVESVREEEESKSEEEFLIQ